MLKKNPTQGRIVYDKDGNEYIVIKGNKNYVRCIERSTGNKQKKYRYELFYSKSEFVDGIKERKVDSIADKTNEVNHSWTESLYEGIDDTSDFEKTSKLLFAKLKVIIDDASKKDQSLCIPTLEVFTKEQIFEIFNYVRNARTNVIIPDMGVMIIGERQYRGHPETMKFIDEYWEGRDKRNI